MDPRKNPYAPGAGTKPPALVGRDEQVESFDVLLERLENGYSEQSLIVTGLRGVGKTVLLDVFREKAEARSWATVEWEVEKSAPFASKMAAQVRRALLQIAPKAKWTERGLKAAAILKSFTLTFNPDGAMTAGLDVEALAGSADSGSLGEDLTDLLVALGEAAREQGIGVIFLVDEIQYLQASEFEALIAALHKCATVAARDARWSGPATDTPTGGRGKVVQRAPVSVPSNRPARCRTRCARCAYGSRASTRHRVRGRRCRLHR
jgi:hypothetical protein